MMLLILVSVNQVPGLPVRDRVKTQKPPGQQRVVRGILLLLVQSTLHIGRMQQVMRLLRTDLSQILLIHLVEGDVLV